MFGALIQNHQQMIHSLTYRMTGSMADAEDLAQETFIQAFKRIQTFREEARFSTWLYRIAMNASLDWLNRNARREATQKEWVYSNADNSAGETRAARVEGALLKLKPKQRAAITLTVYEGMNHAEAARILGCSETTVSWRVFTARRRLKQLLQNDHDGETLMEEWT